MFNTEINIGFLSNNLDIKWSKRKIQSEIMYNIQYNNIIFNKSTYAVTEFTKLNIFAYYSLNV